MKLQGSSQQTNNAKTIACVARLSITARVDRLQVRAESICLIWPAPSSPCLPSPVLSMPQSNLSASANAISADAGHCYSHDRLVLYLSSDWLASDVAGPVFSIPSLTLGISLGEQG